MPSLEWIGHANSRWADEGDARERQHKNVSGHSMLKPDAPLLAEIPEVTAPAHFDVDAESHCFLKRQPENVEQVDRMLLTMMRSEVGCIRYGGTDECITRRLAEQEMSGSRSLRPVRRREPPWSNAPTGRVTGVAAFPARALDHDLRGIHP